VKPASELKFWIGFNLVSGIGPVKFRRLADFFGDLGEAWQATPMALRQAGLDPRALESLLATRGRVSLEAETDRLWQLGVTALTWDDAEYPERLRQIDNPPPLLYVKGKVRPEDEWAIAMVGTRRATVYGREAARRLAAELARNNLTVVSGLAKGIDSHAHQAALEAGGRTIAVLGCGVDVIYPPENRRLAGEVVASGALVSEYPLGTQPEASNFPPRNRIISGLSLGTVVVESHERSGALITADFALEQGRDVFAVPGSIFSKASAGCHALIKQGAKLVATGQDILEELNLTMVSQHQEVQEILPTNELESTILKILSSEPQHIDEIRRECGLPIATVSATLTMMELKGMTRQVGGMNYVLAREAHGDYRVD
jgi:DNA processing protein